MLLKEYLSNCVQKAVKMPNQVCVYNYTIFLCKMQINRQLSNARIIAGSMHMHMTIVDMQMIMEK